MTSTIFVVDDDPGLAEVIARELSGPERRVLTFCDPICALAALGNERADLLITDLSMPWVDGQDMVIAATQRQPDLPIILMSGYPRGEDLAARQHLAFLHKPFDLEQLLAEVESALGRGAPK